MPNSYFITNINIFNFYLNSIECDFKNHQYNFSLDSFLYNLYTIYDFKFDF